MYNYQAPPGQYGAPPPNFGYPGQPGAPPGMGPPPGMGGPLGMGAPGVAPAPGMQPQSQQHRGFPPNFQPPANMPDINFAAPVIRLGTSGPGKPDQGPREERRGANNEPLGNRRGMGLGYDRDQQRSHLRENMMALQAPTREEIARTIFVGNIVDAFGGDESLSQILNAAGGLRRWIRVIDADNKPCNYGFAEYEDADSLAMASEVLKDVPVPGKQPQTNGVKSESNGIKSEDEDETKPKAENGEDSEMKDEGADIKKEEGGHESTSTDKLLVIVDEASQKYIEDWRGKGSLKDPAEAHFRIDSAKDELQNILAGLSRPKIPESSHAQFGRADQDGDTPMGEQKTDTITGEVVTIPITVEDELSDIPTEMRETVAKEIAAFRDRSNRRDMERLKKEEEMEQAEKQRSNTARINSISTSTANANNIPLGPRDRGVQGAPSGPRAYQGVQIPRDYQKGVTFVNGTGLNGVSGLNQEDEDSDASDEEIERRKQEKKNADLEKLYLDQERRWLNRERSRTAAVEREKKRDQEETQNFEKEKKAVATRLTEWNDDIEASRKVEEYYSDRSMWLRNRALFRAQEAEADNFDRAAEDRYNARMQEKKDREMGVADQFLARQAEEFDSQAAMPREPQRFKMSLGTATAPKAQTTQKRTIADVEGLLEDEEDTAGSTTKRTLVPIQFDTSAHGAGLSEEERQQATRQLAAEIPSDKDGLWNWDVKWDYVDESVVTEQLRPFVEKKIVEYLGVQEQMLVDVVEDVVKKHGKPEDLVLQLEGALDDEAEVLVKKLWRMLIFFSETEKRGLGG